MNVANPAPSSVPVPSTAPPSRNVTVPVGCVIDCPDFTTVAVKITLCPLTAGSRFDASIVIVEAGAA